MQAQSLGEDVAVACHAIASPYAIRYLSLWVGACHKKQQPHDSLCPLVLSQCYLAHCSQQASVYGVRPVWLVFASNSVTHAAYQCDFPQEPFPRVVVQDGTSCSASYSLLLDRLAYQGMQSWGGKAPRT